MVVFMVDVELTAVVTARVVLVSGIAVLVVVSSHPLHVLSHRSPLTSHSPCAKIVWQSCKDNWLCLVAQPFVVLE